MPYANQKIALSNHEIEQITSSKAQKKFNELIKKIDEQKKLLQEWQETNSKYQQRFHAEYQPIADDYNDCRMALVYLLDEAHGDKFFKKTDKAKLKELICNLSMELIYAGKEELKAIYNRYSDRAFDEDEMATDSMFAELEMQAEEAQQAQHYYEENRNRHKKSAKQIVVESTQKEDEQNASKSIQDIFRKLVAALHPDREPDEAERERKTKLMQRVNVAYTKKDLLQLLALQLEIEQIDQTHLNTMTEERLKQFNKVLQTQFSELKQEIAQIEYPFKAQLNASWHSNLQPEQVLKSLVFDIKEIQLMLKHAKNELKEFQNPANLKAALKSYRL
ncbi:MAG: hypothetical protein PHN45_07090 [Methylococcales bacterium]|nr:hypothetical protein [Methylococcales bacterium]